MAIGLDFILFIYQWLGFICTLLVFWTKLNTISVVVILWSFCVYSYSWAYIGLQILCKNRGTFFIFSNFAYIVCQELLQIFNICHFWVLKFGVSDEDFCIILTFNFPETFGSNVASFCFLLLWICGSRRLTHENNCRKT